MSNIAKRQHAVNTSRTSEGDAFSSLIVGVFKLNGLLTGAGDALTKPVGQSTARWQVLAAAEEEPVTVAHIARVLGLTRQSVQRVANVLVGEGFAAYSPNPRDRRADLLGLTDSGRTTLQEIQARQRVWADALGAEVGAADLAQAQALLARIAELVAKASKAS